MSRTLVTQLAQVPFLGNLQGPVAISAGTEKFDPKLRFLETEFDTLSDRKLRNVSKNTWAYPGTRVLLPNGKLFRLM